MALAMADAIIARGKNPFFLTRGYGGRLSGPIIVSSTHNAADVGDEPLILARKSSTVVAHDRTAGAKLAVDCGADLIVMDDGHQNFALVKDLSIVVVDAEIGFGNGHVLPAGPLRESIVQGLARADAVVVMGNGNPDLAGFGGPVLRAHIEPVPDREWRGQRIAAFAGIGRPEKFFRTIKDLGAELVEVVTFADHHPITPDELTRLKIMARDQKAQLLTTEKDYLRLPPDKRQEIAMLPIRVRLESADALERLLDRLAAPR